MEVEDDQITGCNDSMAHIMKGKRSKRQRVSSSIRLGPLGMAYSSTSYSGGRTSDGYDSGIGYGYGYDRVSTLTVATSVEFRERRTEEEEDMANCLILLAQGQRSRNRKVSEISGTAGLSTAAAGLCAYQCKTCSKCFPSFQALGGHRTSHTKQKTMTNAVEEKQSAGSGSLIDQENDIYSDTTAITDLSLRMSNGALFISGNSNNKQKLHECSLCDAVFSSGQALGGHMRRHRSFLSITAPEADQGDEKLTFQPKEQVLVLTATPLLDCPL